MSKANASAEHAATMLSDVTLVHPFRVPGTNEMHLHLSTQKGFKLEDIGGKIRVTREGRIALVPWSNVIGAIEA
jgi:hypothetical protein